MGIELSSISLSELLGARSGEPGEFIFARGIEYSCFGIVGHYADTM